MNTAIQHCFRLFNHTIDVAHLSPNHDRDARMPQSYKGRTFIHIVRDPVGTVISGYQYHRANLSFEPWLHDHFHARDTFKYDWQLQSHLQEGETYQQFLRRVPLPMGLRAEVVRMVRKDLSPLIHSNELCDRGKDWCTEVCLESFVNDSSSYNSTWARALNLGGIKNVTPLVDCLAKIDLNGPHAKLGMYGVPYNLTEEFVSNQFVALAQELIRSVDDALYQGELAMLSRRFSCRERPVDSGDSGDLSSTPENSTDGEKSPRGINRWRRLVEHAYA